MIDIDEAQQLIEEFVQATNTLCAKKDWGRTENGIRHLGFDEELNDTITFLLKTLLEDDGVSYDIKSKALKSLTNIMTHASDIPIGLYKKEAKGERRSNAQVVTHYFNKAWQRQLDLQLKRQAIFEQSIQSTSSSKPRIK